MLTFFFAIRNMSANNERTASLAFHFSGFAVTRIFKESPNHPATEFLDEPGITLIFSNEITLILESPD